MQAIQTKYLPATNYRGSRVKAGCDRRAVTFTWDHELDVEANHVAAAQFLCQQFLAEDEAQYGTPRDVNPWGRKRVCGGLPDGSFVHVFTGEAP